MALIAAAVLLGLDENILQAVGNIAGEIPVVGVWFNFMSGVSRAVMTESFTETAHRMLGLVLVCVSSNLLDSFFLGFTFSLTKQLVGRTTEGRWGWKLNLGTTIVSTIVGVLVLWLMKRGDERVQAIIVVAANIVLMAIGLMILLPGGGGMFRAFFFLYDAAAGAIEAGGGIGLICSVLLLPSMVRNGLNLAWYAIWLACLIGLIMVMRLISISDRQL